jgi:DNA-binding transcriptional ArsR family regulator
MGTALDSIAALGEPRRREIFEILSAEPASVGTLAKRLPIVTRSAISQHLRVLIDARLVTYRSEGTRNIYQIDPAGVAELRAYLDSLWERVLPDFKAAAEESYSKAKNRRAKGKKKT